MDMVMGGCTGYATIVTKNPETGDLTDEFFYEWPSDRSHLNRFVSTVTTEDVYFSPLLYNSPRRLKANAKEAAVVYSDADTCDPSNFRIMPSIVVQTSPGRWHCYWVLDATYSAAQVSEVSHKIAVAHSHQGCDLSGWIMSKLLRIPGTTNTKYGKPFTVTAEYTGAIYTLTEIDSAYSDIELEPEVEIGEFDLPSDWPDLSPLLERIPRSSELAELYLDPWEIREDGSHDRSERRWNLINLAAEAGFTAQEACVLAWNSRVNKYRDEGRPITQLFEEVKKAFSRNSKLPSAKTLEIIQNFGKEDESEQDGLDPQEEFTIRQKFLTDEERRYLPRTIVEDYVDWMATRTDSPAVYQIANCLAVLSAVFSDVAFIAPRQGAMGLNCWFMILGDTTATRKSTARDLMLMFLHAVERVSFGYQVDIGSDVTRESLQKTLADRDGKTTFVHKDEVQGYFREQKVKAFRSGETDFFTDIYGGTVPVSIRNDKDNKSSGKRSKTNFLLHFMGIPSEVASALSIDYFKSGFLARFLYVTADGGEMTEEREMVEQADDFDSTGEMIDSRFTALVKQTSNMRTKMRRSTGPWAIKMTAEALARWNKFKYDTALAARGQRYFEAIEPSRQRLAFSTWKVAAILALSEGSSIIEIKHVLKAISYAEDWFENLVLLASQISASDWEGFIDQIESVIRQSNRTRYTTLARKFPGKKKRELEEALQSLVAQGRVMDTTVQKTGVRFLSVGEQD